MGADCWVHLLSICTVKAGWNFLIQLFTDKTGHAHRYTHNAITLATGEMYAQQVVLPTALLTGKSWFVGIKRKGKMTGEKVLSSVGQAKA